MFKLNGLDALTDEDFMEALAHNPNQAGRLSHWAYSFGFNVDYQPSDHGEPPQGLTHHEHDKETADAIEAAQ